MACLRGAGFAGLAIAALLFIGGCGDDGDTPPIDSGADDTGAPDSGPPIDAGMLSPIAAVASPLFTPCPAGWREDLDGGDGFAICQPFPTASPDGCALGAVHLPGRPGCEPVTSPCPSDGWPAGLSAPDDAVYVRAGSAGGDGTRPSPFSRIADAVAATPDGGTVAVSVGLYEESVSLDRPMTVVGACVETIVGGTFGFRIRAAARVENLRVTGGAIAVRVGAGGNAVLRDLVLDGSGVTALNAEDGSVDAENISIRDAGNSGITCARGSFDGRRIALVGTNGVAVDARECDFSVADLTIAGTGAAGPLPQLVNADSESVMTLTRGAFLDNRASEVFVFNDAVLTMEDVVIRQPAEGERSEQLSVIASAGGDINLTRVRLERARFVALGTAFPGSTLVARDVWVREVVSGPSTSVGYGLEVSEGAAADLARVRIEAATGLGILVSGGASLVAEDVAVSGTRTATDGTFGRGLQVQLLAEVDVSRMTIEDSREAGIVVTGARVGVTDLVIDRVIGAGTDNRGPGIGAGSYVDGRLVIERFSIRSAALAGLQLASGGEIDLTDGEVADNPIGVNVQVDGFDLGRLMERVFYRENAVNLDSEALPVPDPTTGTSG